jgi:hypothetical protein
MSDITAPVHVPHDGTDAEARPIFTEERRILGIASTIAAFHIMCCPALG